MTSAREVRAVIRFEDFVRRAAPAVARHLTHGCERAGVDVQDVVQEAVIRAFKNWPQLSRLQPRQQYGWLATTAGRILIDHVRAPYLAKRADIDLAWNTETVDPACGPEALAEARERLRRVCAMIEALSAQEQEVVIMYAVLGYEYIDIAGYLGTTTEAVTTAMSRARKKLRTASDQEERA